MTNLRPDIPGVEDRQTNRSRIIVGRNSDGDSEEAYVEGGSLYVKDSTLAGVPTQNDHLEQAMHGIRNELRKITLILNIANNLDITDEDVE